MAKSGNQKRKLLCLLEILRRETDEEHPLSLEQLRLLLEAQGIPAERKSLYDDLEQLRVAGEDIVTLRGRGVTYYLGQRTFDMPELRLLVDAVQSSQFITHRKSAELIGKLEGLCSRHQAGRLQRQVTVAGRVKSMNESIYYNVDSLQNALADDRQVTFRYFDWDVHKQRRLRHDGALYTVSPWALTWDSENYYLVAYEASGGAMRHYRVDRMLHITETEDKRLGGEVFARMDMARYTRRTFGMFGGEEQTVTLHCAEWMTGVIIDRFGRDVAMLADESGFTVRVPVVLSPAFFAWLSGFGRDMTLVAPADAAAEYRRYLTNILAAYSGEG